MMIEHVYLRASGSSLLNELWIATDSQEVLEACKKRKIPALLTSDQHLSGTDRIHEVMRQKRADIYVNIQGDEPLVRPQHLEDLLKPFLDQKDVRVATLKTKISHDIALSPNVVKVVTDAQGWALYFSRSLIPLDREGKRAFPVYKHLGFYAYAAEALEKFHSLPPTPLEQAEKLEQLRILENRIPIFVAETSYDTIGVDTEEDLQRVEGLLLRNGFTRLSPR
jgi:3-deoxy-manno-octulosonate cytidylyltransferase (CMP-KDO synthetase)